MTEENQGESTEAPKKKDVLRETDDDARTLAKRLMWEANSASLACLCPKTGAPLISRTAFMLEPNGTPVILVSELSAHTGALMADGRCSMLFGEPGRGDALAYPRISVDCEAEVIKSDDPERSHIRATYLLRNPKAELYIDFGDFHFIRLKPKQASLNGGFGRAYALEADDIIIPPSPVMDEINEASGSVIEHMNEDHLDSVAEYAQLKGRDGEQAWRMIALNSEAMILASDHDILRFPFDAPLKGASAIRGVLVSIAKQARG